VAIPWRKAQSTINDHDEVSGSTVDGVLYSGCDSYEFSGEISSISAGGEIITYIDGEQTDLGG
jgi:hypothetical protein